VFWICVLVYTYLCLILFSLFCILVLGYGSSASNENIVRFRCGGSHTPFLHIFNFCIVCLGFEVIYALFDWFLISNCLVASLYISRMCMIGRLSIV